MLLYAGGDENNGGEGDGDNMGSVGDGDNMGGGGDGDNMGGGMCIIEKVRRATSGAETAYPSGGPEFTPGF